MVARRVKQQRIRLVAAEAGILLVAFRDERVRELRVVDIVEERDFDLVPNSGPQRWPRPRVLKRGRRFLVGSRRVPSLEVPQQESAGLASERGAGANAA